MLRGGDAREKAVFPPRPIPRTRRRSRWLVVALLLLAATGRAGGATEDTDVGPPRILARGHLGGDGEEGVDYWVGELGGQQVVHFIEVGLFLTRPLTCNRSGSLSLVCLLNP